ncbi:MAG: hypothetical protein A2Y17_10430 [Clostridiales bacterium GWF2_38_85]|nr:MAG: hypothetical protein A2Y17_10430 [Clostridiales bacterium GWF2_38_85]
MDFNQTTVLNSQENNDPNSRLVQLVLLVSSGIIINGGETSRADACASNMLRANGGNDIQIFSLPTVVIITVTITGKSYMKMKSITTRDYDLGRIDLLNKISRAITEHSMTVEEAFTELEKPEKKFNYFFIALFSGLSAAFFTIMFDGGILEFISAVIASCLCQITVDSMQKHGVFLFVANVVGSFITAVAAIALNYLINSDVSIVIIGGIIPLVPGLAVTNATRDSVNGDLVSGSARWLDSIVTAISIAAGVGVALALEKLLT